MKRILAFVLTLIIVLGLAACGQKPAFEGADIKIGVLKGPTGMGAAWLMNETEAGNTVNRYDFTVAGAPDELTGRLVSGDLDIAALPTNAISALYNKTEGEIVTLGVNTLGVLYIVEKGESIKSVADLEGKTILASGQGSTAEYVLSYILEQNGVSAEIYWASEHSEAATLALSGEYDIAMFPEPFVTNVTKKDASFRVALDLSEEWENLGGGVLTMGGIAVRKAFLEENPEAVAEFIKEFGKSVEFTNENPTEAAAIIEKFDIAPAAVAESALPRCNIVWLSGDDYAETLESFLSVIFEANPKSIGGKMPGEDFYS